MKQFRAILEDDMGLPEKSLREHKDAIEEMVDEVSSGQSSIAEAIAHRLRMKQYLPEHCSNLKQTGFPKTPGLI